MGRRPCWSGPRNSSPHTPTELRWTAYGDAWDAIVQQQSLDYSGSSTSYERFRDGWNHYREPDLEFDKPSGLFEQLRWLSEAGLREVDCYWLRAGHAIYGGYK